MNDNILTDVLTQPLAVEPSHVYAYWTMLHNFMDGKAVADSNFSEARVKAQMYAVQSSSTVFLNRWTNLDEVPKGSVAIISLTGPVVKNSQFCGPRGTVDIANDFERAKNNSNIIGAVFYAETGGGMALAVKPLADAMKNFRQEKPIVALTGSVIASAGYYLAVYADEIMSEHPRSIVGSIGTMMAFADITAAMEKQGIKFHEIYATESTLKNKTFNEALKGNYNPLIKNMLDPINEDFIADVKQEREGKIKITSKEIFAGETFMATAAMNNGMIDSLGNLTDAVARVEAMAKTNYSKSAHKKDVNMKFDNVLALAGKTVATPEEVDAANKDLTEAGVTGFTIVAESLITEAAEATAALEMANANIEALTADAASAQAQAATLGTENAALKAKLAKGPAIAAAVVAPEDPKLELSQDEETARAMAELPHERAAAANPLFN